MRLSATIAVCLLPAGLQYCIEKVTRKYFKMPEEPATDATPMIGSIIAGVMVDMQKKCGDDLTRENLLRQANGFNGVPLPLPLLVDGVHHTTTPEDDTPFREARLYRFDGIRWVGFGPVSAVPSPGCECGCNDIKRLTMNFGETK
jgi:hypothetical protein